MKPTEYRETKESRFLRKLKALPPNERADVLTVVKRLHAIKVARAKLRKEREALSHELHNPTSEQRPASEEAAKELDRFLPLPSRSKDRC